MFLQVLNTSILDNMLAEVALGSVSICLLVVLLQLCEELPDETRRRASFVLWRVSRQQSGSQVCADVRGNSDA